MSLPSIQVVIVNWRRPANILPIVQAFRAQTAPCTIIVCDVGGEGYRLDAETVKSADSVFVWDRNFGSFNRYIPAFGFEKEYCWFHDDDMVPGPEMLAYMLSFQDQPFSVLGQDGRRINGDHYSYVQGAKLLQEADFVCRGYLVRTELLHCIMRYKWETRLDRPLILEDDILLAAAVNAYTGLRAWVTPRPPFEARMNQRELPAPFACSAMSDHFSRRKAFFHECKRNVEQIANTRLAGNPPL